MRTGAKAAGEVLLGLLTIGTALFALLFITDIPWTGGSLPSDDRIAFVYGWQMTIWSSAGTILLIWGLIRWARGGPWVGVAAAWIATPVWAAGFSLVFIALAVTVAVTVVAITTRASRTTRRQPAA